MEARALLWAGLMLAAGCRQLLGIDDPSVAAPDAPPLPYTVTGSATVRGTHLDANGAVIPDVRRYTAAELTAVAILDDGTPSPVAIDEDGTFRFGRATETQAYRLRLTTPRGSAEYQHTAAELDLIDRYAGRLDATPVTHPTHVIFSMGGALPSASLFAMSAGIWSNTSAGSGTDAHDLDWSNVVASPPGLIDATKNDRLYLGALTGSGPSALVLSTLATYNVTLIDGADQLLNGATAALAPDHCAHISARRGDALDRLAVAAPIFASGTRAGDFRIGAMPDLESPLGYQLYQAIDIAATDVDTQLQYPAPFPGTQVLALDAALYRMVPLSDGHSVSFAIGGLVVRPLSTMGCPTQLLQSTIALAGPPSIGGVRVAQDDQAVTLGDGDLRTVAAPVGIMGTASPTFRVMD